MSQGCSDEEEGAEFTVGKKEGHSSIVARVAAIRDKSHLEQFNAQGQIMRELFISGVAAPSCPESMPTPVVEANPADKPVLMPAPDLITQACVREV
jgi:hypothetical protein